MSNRSFMANSWLTNDSKKNITSANSRSNNPNSYNFNTEGILQSQALQVPPVPLKNEDFVPSRYFIPGWSGNSLFSKNAIAVKKIQEQLWEDALKKFRNAENLPPSLLNTIFNEFLGFINPKGTVHEININSHSLFWSEMKNPESKHRNLLDRFSELYSFRVATNYLCRLKFLVTYSKAIGIDFKKADLINPSSFSQRLFRKGSSSEIHCQAFKINQYSWYRPHEKYIQRLENLTKFFHEISITQMMKVCSFREFQSSTRSMEFNEMGYSHALSHKAVGKFLNSLLVFFPLWNKQENFKFPTKEGYSNPKILNTKFVGDHIESLGQSHWLAQEENLKLPLSEIICSEFASEEPGAELFIKLIQELHFLTFLVSYSINKNLRPKEILSKITRERFNTIKNQSGSQFNLFANKEISYDRCILNASNLPKKNPHHHLITKIISHKGNLNNGAYLIVLSNQKIFVPSQSKKVQDLLVTFKVEAAINLEKLKGKGEVSNYVYILKKRGLTTKSSALYHLPPSSGSSVEIQKQETCYTFRYQGDLKQFSQFDLLVEDMMNFFTNRSSFTTSIYQKNINDSLHFEFHQDAIIDGKLLSSLSHEQDKITHPQFFKNLTKGCTPLESFFSIVDLDNNDENNLTNTLLGISASASNFNHQILIVNLTSPVRPEIEICSQAAIKAKKEEYGVAYYQYFKIIPKITHINYNLLKEFFESSIGNQIIQICLSGGMTKVKGKLKGLLIPNFFKGGFEIQNSIFHSSYFAKVDKKQLLEEDPSILDEKFEKELNSLQAIKSESIWGYLSLLTHLKIQLKMATEQLSETSNQELAFNNPLICKELANLKTQKVYPNDEIFTEILIDQKEDMDKPITQGLISDDDLPNLKVFHQDTCLLKFYADKEVLIFINFILNKAAGHSLLTVLQNMSVPKSEDLKNILKNHQNLTQALFKVSKRIDDLLKSEITKEIARF